MKDNDLYNRGMFDESDTPEPESESVISDETDDSDKKHYNGYEETVRIMEMYNSGQKKEASTQLIEQIKYFIWQQMRKIYPTYFQNEEIRDDMYNEAVLEVLKAMEKYNAEKTSPTTFFSFFIIGGFRKAIEDTYDQRNSPEFKKIAWEINRFEQANKPLVEIDIAVAAKVSITDVKKYFEYKNSSDLVYISENPETDKDIKQKIQTPEEQFFENEKNENISLAILNLPEQERNVIYTFFYTKPSGRFEKKKRHTFESAAEMLGMDKDLVRVYLQKGLKHLKKDPKLKDYHFEKFTKFSDSVEFISHDVSAYDCIGDENDGLGDFEPVKAQTIQNLETEDFILKPFSDSDYKDKI